ncbi:uncharacterized protein si:ch211-155m12.1 [Danio aesculapii]|uniref:uncharacterized protein si:ch211-155m12.1 n=1 Tax=Danio aesculapii TaxID=1142201 RepID=UPI0024BFB60F|nr:uncharacterized protein si:ch211-155m12.1 [Danio aesculapii]
MKITVLIISNLFLITAAPVDQHHEIEARSASEEDGQGALQALLTEMRDTLANVNRPPITDPTTKPTGLQELPPQVQTAYVLNPLPFGPSPPADPKPAPQAPVPQINLFISGVPQQDRPAAAETPKPVPLQQLVLANAEPVPAIQNPAQVMALPAQYGPVLPQNAMVMPANNLPQAYPNIGSPLQSSALLGPQVSPYFQPFNFQPLNPYLGHHGFGSYPFYPPPMYHHHHHNPYFPNYGMPNVAISPPIIFRERGQTATSQG